MNETWLEKIEEYLSGDMSQEEQMLFEKELSTNKELSSDFNLYKAIEAEMHANENYEADEAPLRKTLQELNARYVKSEGDQNAVRDNSKEQARPGTTATRIKMLMRLAVAASLLGVIVLGALWYVNREKKEMPFVVNRPNTNSADNSKKPDTSFRQKNIPPSPIAKQESSKSKPNKKKPTYNAGNLKQQTLFAANFQPDNVPEIVPDTLQQAFAYYQSKDYKNAITALESLNTGVEERGYEDENKQRIIFYALYYKALSYMAEGNAKKAIPDLNTAIVKSPDEFSKSRAQWSLALAYLKQGSIQKAGRLLKQVVNGTSPGVYRQKARKLISELKKT